MWKGKVEPMPIFEYVCRTCDKRFETIVRGSAKPACPACGGSRLEKQLSVFAVAGGGADLSAREPVGPCGSCGDPRGPGSCSFDN
jgi:putative FmdB family regulatory protein